MLFAGSEIYFKYVSRHYPGAIPQQSPLVHHVHTYHQGPELKQDYETDSDDNNYVKRCGYDCKFISSQFIFKYCPHWYGLE